MSLIPIKEKCGMNVKPILLLAALLRFYRLGSESLWIDEGYSLRDANGITSLMDVRPLYFLMLRGWMSFGYGEAWLRSLSVIFGIGSVYLLFLLGQRLFDRKVGLIASLIMAISPLQINHSQEIRMYTLATFLVLAEVLFFIKYIERARLRDLLASLVMAGAAFLVFPLSVFMFLALDVFLLIRLKQRSRQAIWWFAGQVAGIVAALPMRSAFLGVTRSYGEAWTWRLQRPGALALLQEIRDFNLWRIPDGRNIAIFAGNVYGLAVLALAAYGVWRFLKIKGWQTQLTMLWLVVPIITTLLVSRVFVNLWVGRYMIYASPAFYLLTALGIASLSGRRIQMAALACVLLFPIARLGVYYVKPNRPEWRQAVRYVQDNLADRDIIGVYRYGNRYVFDYYYDGSAQWYPLGDEALSRSSFSDWTDRRIRRTFSILPDKSQRIWFVLSVHENTGGFQIENYIHRNYHILEMRDYKQVRVYLVTRNSARRAEVNAARLSSGQER